MKQLIDINNDNVKYLLFCLDDKKYAIEVAHVLEILKLPELDYPQKLPYHLCGLLNYNHLTINIVDINRILDFESKPFSIDNQLLILKTEESIFGIIVDKVLDLVPISPHEIHPRPYNSQNNLIKFITYINKEMVFIFDLYSTEKYIKENETKYVEDDIQEYFPKDEESKRILQERKNNLKAKADYILPKIFLDSNEFIWFTIDDYNYCISIGYVKEILKKQDNTINKVPCTPDYINGIITLRGDFYTLIDMHKFLELNDSDFINSAKKIIVINSQDFKIAFLVSEVHDILTLSSSDFTAPVSDKFESKYINGEFIKDDTLFRVMDIKKIFKDNKLLIRETV